MPIWAAAHPRLLFLLAKDQEIPKGISNETGQREAMPAREAGVFKMKEFHFERVLEKEAKRRMTKGSNNTANLIGKSVWFGHFSGKVPGIRSPAKKFSGGIDALPSPVL
jgi:hypothetical protein